MGQSRKPGRRETWVSLLDTCPKMLWDFWVRPRVKLLVVLALWARGLA